MKQNAEEPDYRSMNEVQLKSELIKLEKKILDITGDPIDYKHYCPFLDWCKDDAKVEAVEEMMLDRCFILNLLFDIHCTPAEVAYQKSINNCNMRPSRLRVRNHSPVTAATRGIYPQAS